MGVPDPPSAAPCVVPEAVVVPPPFPDCGLLPVGDPLDVGKLLPDAAVTVPFPAPDRPPAPAPADPVEPPPPVAGEPAFC